MTDSQIIAEYERQEKEAGGVAVVGAKEICNRVAVLLDVPFERVRSVMLDHWNIWAAG